jgi:hypothetical protein
MDGKQRRNEAAVAIHHLLYPGGLFIVDDSNACDLDPRFLRLEKKHQFDGETMTVSLFNLIESKHRMLKHILRDDHRELFERYDACRCRATTQVILRHRLIFKIIYELAKPLVWLSRLFVGSVTVRRLLSAIQRCPYSIYVYRRP